MEIIVVPFGVCPADGTHTLKKVRNEELVAYVFRHTYTEPLSWGSRIMALFLRRKYEQKHYSSELTILDTETRMSLASLNFINGRRIGFWLKGDHDAWGC